MWGTGGTPEAGKAEKVQLKKRQLGSGMETESSRRADQETRGSLTR